MKKRKYKYKRYFPIPFCLLIFIFLELCGCANNECYDNKNSLPLAGFYSSSRVPQAISIDSVSIHGIGAPGDSILQDSVRTLSQTYLPFRIDEGNTTYVIQYLGGDLGKHKITDTIEFIYDIKPWFVSSACGVIYDYKMQDIKFSTNLIDSVTCPDGEITNVSKENIHIYFRTDNEEEEEL